MLGRRKSGEVAQWMRAADIFCLPSHSEGCPNVIVEALACGRPIVASNVGGIPELVDEGCGILMAPRDPGKLRWPHGLRVVRVVAFESPSAVDFVFGAEIVIDLDVELFPLIGGAETKPIVGAVLGLRPLKSAGVQTVAAGQIR